MPKYLDFENQEKGFKLFEVNRKNIRANIGKLICYVDYVEPRKGTYIVKYAMIDSIHYNTLFLDEMRTQIDILKIKEAGIEA